MDFVIKPNDGIGPIKLGMLRKQVKELLSKYFVSSEGSIDYYFENSLQIEFENELANFIGISQSNFYNVIYENIDVFKTDGSELFRLIASNETGSHTLNASEYMFPEQIVTLWDLDSQYDHIGNYKKAVWAQIGIGTNSYLQFVNGL
ncbi:hypothetical protein KO495_05860 [Colwellia sp. D2M02]|uniref:hypothetical protein n=1 Tax=Colwellia sp. D2M02 TaxID=2841562 RepID=UPI001C083C0C|nr:hypothetical protein [Colwellia sp. D2M02]MBU2892847.1 hypothetical protein [Colwellia sp. D2M02]